VHTTPHHTTLHTTQEKVDFFRRWNVVWWCGVVWPIFCVHFSLPEGGEKGVLATIANIVLGVWENTLFPL